jgi:hypothetical protein
MIDIGGGRRGRNFLNRREIYSVHSFSVFPYRHLYPSGWSTPYTPLYQLNATHALSKVYQLAESDPNQHTSQRKKRARKLSETQYRPKHTTATLTEDAASARPYSSEDFIVSSHTIDKGTQLTSSASRTCKLIQLL